MTREEIEKKIAEMEAGIAELKEELKKAENINPDVFTPELGEKYLTIQSGGDIFINYWNYLSIDKDRLAIGNVLRTREEAEFEVERLKVIHELKMYAEPKSVKWDGEKKHVYIVYDMSSNNIKIEYCFWYKRDSLYFSSEDRVREAIKAVGEDRVKKYYLGVEEDD